MSQNMSDRHKRRKQLIELHLSNTKSVSYWSNTSMMPSHSNRRSTKSRQQKRPKSVSSWRKQIHKCYAQFCRPWSQQPNLNSKGTHKFSQRSLRRQRREQSRLRHRRGADGAGFVSHVQPAALLCRASSLVLGNHAISVAARGRMLGAAKTAALMDRRCVDGLGSDLAGDFRFR